MKWVFLIFRVYWSSTTPKFDLSRLQLLVAVLLHLYHSQKGLCHLQKGETSYALMGHYMNNEQERPKNGTLWNTKINSLLGRLFPLYVTYCCLSLRQLWNQFKADPLILLWCSLCSRTSWLTVSKAFEKSRKTPIINHPFSSDCVILSINIIKAM